MFSNKISEGNSRQVISSWTHLFGMGKLTGKQDPPLENTPDASRQCQECRSLQHPARCIWCRASAEGQRSSRSCIAPKLLSCRQWTRPAVPRLFANSVSIPEPARHQHRAFPQRSSCCRKAGISPEVATVGVQRSLAVVRPSGGSVTALSTCKTHRSQLPIPPQP